MSPPLRRRRTSTAGSMPRGRCITPTKLLPHAEYCPQGTEIKAEPGTSICEALLENDIAIEHACDMVCACTTCHVIVRQGYDSLEDPTEKEEDMLDKAWGLEATSRLSCQAKIADQDLVIEIPKYTINYEREGGGKK